MEEKGRRLALQAVFTCTCARTRWRRRRKRRGWERIVSFMHMRGGHTWPENWKHGSYILCISSLRRSYITWKCAGRRVFNQGGDLRFTGCSNINETPLPERVQNDSPWFLLPLNSILELDLLFVSWFRVEITRSSSKICSFVKTALKTRLKHLQISGQFTSKVSPTQNEATVQNSGRDRKLRPTTNAKPCSDPNENRWISSCNS